IVFSASVKFKLPTRNACRLTSSWLGIESRSVGNLVHRSHNTFPSLQVSLPNQMRTHERNVDREAPRPSSRAVALSILLFLSSRQTDDALDELIEQQSPSMLQRHDRSLVMELVYGVLRRQETIDWRLDAVLSKPLHRLPVVVQVLLRLGAYQLLFLDRIPASAAVNETVRLTKSYVKQ